MTKRYLLIVLGWLCVTLGSIGAVLPLLPTVPFLLLAGWCFARSSERFHNWLLSQKYFGPILRDWERDGSLTRQTRNRALVTLWLSLFLSMWIIGKPWACVLLTIIGLGSSTYLVTRPLSGFPSSNSSH